MMKLDVVCVLWNVGKGRCYVGVGKSVHGTHILEHLRRICISGMRMSRCIVSIRFLLGLG